MEKSEVIGTIKTVLNKAGMDDAVHVCEDTNEIGNIMICQKPGEHEYLAINKIPLFMFEAIRNILFAYGDGNYPRRYPQSELQFIFELEKDSSYIVEWVDGVFLGYMEYKGKIIDNQDEILTHLDRLNKYYDHKTNTESLISEIAELDENGEIYNDDEVNEVIFAVEKYIRENSSETEVILYYAYTSLQLYVYSEVDPFDVKHVLSVITQKGLEDELMQYIQNESLGVTGYGFSLLTTALRMFREVNDESVCE